MRRLALVVAVLCSAVLAMRSPRPLDSFAASEQARIRAHFDTVERELRGRSVTGLATSERAARARALERLHAYAARGVFPRNRDFPGAFVPYFIDHRTGTRCAMAHLIEQSGDEGLVARVAATNNNASIPDLKDDPELLAWLERNGLTLEEAARIQPSYCGDLPPGCYCGFADFVPSCPTPSLSGGYKVATGVSVAANVVAVALNVVHTGMARPAAGAVGIVTGVAGIAIGAPYFDDSGSRRTLGFVNAGVGAVSAAIGVYRLTGKRSTVTPVSFAPWFSPDGAAGLSGRITF